MMAKLHDKSQERNISQMFGLVEEHKWYFSRKKRELFLTYLVETFAWYLSRKEYFSHVRGSGRMLRNRNICSRRERNGKSKTNIVSCWILFPLIYVWHHVMETTHLHNPLWAHFYPYSAYIQITNTQIHKKTNT